MILLELVELVAASHKPSVAPGDGVIVSCACRLWTAADMERLVERLEKAVERLENVCQGPGMCGDASAKGEAQGSSQGTAELAQGSLWRSQAGGGCPVELKTQWLQHFLSPGLSLLQVGGAARGCGSLWGAPGDVCALVFSTGVAQYVQAFDALLAGPVAEYTKISREVGGDVQKHVRTPVPPSP